MTRSESKHFQEVLQAKQAELSEFARGLDDIRIEQAPDAIDEVQNATMRDLAIRNLDRDSRQLRLVRDALRRIEEGSFGLCLRCDEPISPKRLNAVPWAAYCLRCQEEVDRAAGAGHSGIAGGDYAEAA